jgi:SAM-dependent methyltransferase
MACPKCGTGLEWSGDSCACPGCGRRFGMAGGFLDMVRESGQPDPAPPTAAQRMMESRAFVRLYERFMRPFFARLFAGRGADIPSPDEEFSIYRSWLPMAGSTGVWLDLSCGSGFFTERMARVAPQAAVVGLDLSTAMLTQAVEDVTGVDNVVWVRGDVRGLPFRDESFDGVNNPGSLHLYADPVAAYREVFRVLRPGGHYTASTFADSDRRIARYTARALGVRRTDLPRLPEVLDYRQVTYGDVFAFVVRRP